MKTLGISFAAVVVFASMTIHSTRVNGELDWSLEDLAEEACFKALAKKADRWRCDVFDDAVRALFDKNAAKFATVKVPSVDAIAGLAMKEPYRTQAQYMLSHGMKLMIEQNIESPADLEDRMMPIFIEWIVRVAWDKDYVVTPRPPEVTNGDDDDIHDPVVQGWQHGTHAHGSLASLVWAWIVEDLKPEGLDMRDDVFVVLVSGALGVVCALTVSCAMPSLFFGGAGRKRRDKKD